MAYEFKKLSEVEVAEAASDAASILVEDGGSIKRVPKSSIAAGGSGGGGGLDLIITTDGDVYTPNITLEEALAIFEEKGWIQGIVKKDLGNGWVYSFSIHTVSAGSNTMTFTAHNETFGYISWTSEGMSFVAGA